MNKKHQPEEPEDFRNYEYIFNVIAEEIEAVTGSTPAEIRSSTRKRPTSDNRHLFCLVTRFMTLATLKVIAWFLDRDHTSIVHSIGTFIDTLETEEHAKELFEQVFDRVHYRLKVERVVVPSTRVVKYFNIKKT